MEIPELSIHDRAVMQESEKLVKDGWEVHAHLKGHKRPKKIGKYIPDIYATRGVYEIVIEVETWKSMFHPHSREQVVAFRNWEVLSFNRTRTFRQVLG